MEGQDLFSQQAANRRRSAWLIAGFVLFFAWIGFGGDLARYLAGGRQALPVPWIGITAVLVATAVVWSSWKQGARRVLGATGAVEIGEGGTPNEIRLVHVVEEMSIAAGLPKPRVWIVPDDDPNAFAAGRDPPTASIAVTRGLLQILERDELQAVVAHEMAHVRNLDVRLMTLLAAMVGAVALMSDSLRHLLRGARSERRRQSPFAVLVLLLWLISLLVAPLVSRLLALAVSRKREYLADATAAQLTRNPLALARALQKLDGAAGATRSISLGAAHLCIVDPGERRLASREGRLGDLLASHPPVHLRIARLRAMGYRTEKETS